MVERQQFNIATVVGSRVQILLHKPAFEALHLQGVESERFVARVLGTDTYGLWVENPNYCSVPVYADDGEYIPPEERAEVCDRAVILIKWDHVLTIMQFPDREHFQPEPADSRPMGFRHRPRGVKAEEQVPIGVNGARPAELGKTARKSSKERKRG